LKLKIPIEGIKAEIRGKNVVIKSSLPLRVLTSSVLSRSYNNFMAILNHQIPKDYDHAEPKRDFLRTIVSLGLPKQTLGLMTAADVNKVSVVNKKHESLTVCAVVTAGVTNPAAAGDNAPKEQPSNTINTVLLIDGNLTQNCMVNAVMTATEAKSAALRELDIRSRLSTELATGTTSDMIAVACTGRGRRIMFAGTATKLGELIGKTVKEAVKTAIQKQHGITPNRSLLKRLEERGISFEKLLNSALELYNRLSSTGAKEEMIQTITYCLKNALTDINVSSLVLAGLRLNEDYRLGLVPDLSMKTHEQDLTFLTAGQTLGMTIANYMAGTKGILTLLKFGEEEPGVLGELEPIASDVFKGLIAGLSPEIMTMGSKN
jgi:iron complex transport system ATP-binding protein